AERELIQWLELRAGVATIRDVQRGPKRYRDNPALAEADLNRLHKHGRGEWLPASSDPRHGGRPAMRFRLRRPGDGDTTPQT
ncbi:MAG: hypothetical protein SH850_13305, partial [Planctomycetaceae bacterium]|nr:hypothetical protein [Planctomycetaceae bacterium]